MSRLSLALLALVLVSSNLLLACSVDVSVPQERWSVLDFWYYMDDPSHPRFTWKLSMTPVGFE